MAWPAAYKSCRERESSQVLSPMLGWALGDAASELNVFLTHTPEVAPTNPNELTASPSYTLEASLVCHGLLIRYEKTFVRVSL